MNQDVISRRNLWISYIAIFLAISAMSYYGVATSLVLVPIANDLHLGSSQIQWVMNSLYISLLAFLMTGGWFSDFFNKMAFLRAGILLLFIGTVLSAIASSFWMLILGRVLFGIAMAIATPATIAYLRTAGSKADQVRGFAYAGFCGGVASALGYFVSGTIEEALSWRWSLGITLLFLFVAIPFTFADKMKAERKPLNFNVAGNILLAISFVSVIIFLDNLSKWKLLSLNSLIFFVVFCFSIVAFAIVEKKPGLQYLKPI